MDREVTFVWGEVYDFNEEKTEAVTSDAYVQQSLLLLKPAIHSIDSTLVGKPVFSKGIFIQDNVPVLFSVRPILTSEDEGPMRGYLIQGKLANEAFLNELQDQIKINFKVDTIDPAGGSNTDI